ncbi:MAG: hypothetical protein ACJ8CB_31975 [Ktedonobacteraceae bacterium]
MKRSVLFHGEKAEALVQAARDAYGRSDILVNSASPSGVIKPFEQMGNLAHVTVLDMSYTVC